MSVWSLVVCVALFLLNLGDSQTIVKICNTTSPCYSTYICGQGESCTVICNSANACQYLTLSAYLSNNLTMILNASFSTNYLQIIAPANGTFNLESIKYHATRPIGSSAQVSIYGNLNTDINIKCIGNTTCPKLQIYASMSNSVNIFCGMSLLLFLF